MDSPTKSIFLTVKKMLGIAEEYHAFDMDVMVNINSVFLNLAQLGVGPKTPYQITGESETWEDFLGADLERFPGVPTYVYLKTRLLFDPPTNSYLVSAMQEQIAEFEFRFEVASVELNWKGGENNGTDLEDDTVDNRAEVYSDPASDARRLRAAWDQGDEVGNSTDARTTRS